MKVEFITTKEAENIKRTMRPTKTMEEYTGYLKQLPENQVGKIVVAPKDTVKPQTVRSRLIRAGKAIGLGVQSKRVGNTVLFWREKQ